jgi:O-antigen/teichoic acid export membrane protein
MLAGQSAVVAAQAAYFIVLARLLGSAEYGIFVGATAMIAVFGTFSSLGSGMLLLRYVSSSHSRFPEYWGHAIVSTLVTGSLVAAAACGGTSLLHDKLHRGVAGMLLMIAVGDCVFARLADCAGQAFQAMERLRVTAFLNALTAALRLTAAIVLWATLGRTTAPVWAAASLCVSGAAVAVAVAMVAVKIGRPRFRPRLLLTRLGEGFGFSVAYSTTSIYNDIDKAMLTRYGMYAANGGYSVAYRFIDIACIPIRALHAAALPRFFRAGATAARGSAAFARRVLKRTFPWGVFAGFALFAGAPMIVPILGASFGPAVTALRWLCPIPMFRTLHLSAGDAITGGGHQRWRTASQLGAAALNVCLNLYCIPKWSWQGAAWSSLATDGALAAANWSILMLLTRQPRTRRRTPLPFGHGSEALSAVWRPAPVGIPLPHGRGSEGLASGLENRACADFWSAV